MVDRVELHSSDKGSTGSARMSLVMLVSADKGDWVVGALTSESELYTYADIREAVKTLQNIRYDLIMIDEALFQDRVVPLVTEIKRRFPYIPLVVISESNDAAHQEKLSAAGADDVITDRLPKKQLQFHITMLLRQQTQNQVLVRLNHNLHLMATLSQILYSTSDSYTLVLQAIKFIRAAFNLYGMAFILKDGDIYRMYAGGEEVVSKNKLFENVIRPEELDPFLWTIRNKAIQIFNDITKNVYYRPIPILNKAESVAIIPLTYQYEVLGAMGIFATAGKTLTHEDMIVYERFGAQLIYALQNASQHRTQRVNIQSSQQLLRAWQIFADLQQPEDVARSLCGLIEEIPNISHGMVWFDPDSRGNFPEIVADTQNNQVIKLFEQVRRRGLVGTIINNFTGETPPTLIEVDSAQDSAVMQIGKVLPVRRIVTLPIASGGSRIGGVIAGVTDEASFGPDDMNQMAALSYIAGQAVERILLNMAITDRNNRLEAIIRSISEGIFFVDDTGKVAFCNPQVAELTSINLSKVQNQDVVVLFNELAELTTNSSQTVAQLLASRDLMAAGSAREEDYPILELALVALERTVTLEFVRIEGLSIKKITWAGVLRTDTQPAPQSRFQTMIINSMAENFRVPYAQVRSLIAMLSEKHGAWGYRERDQLLRQIEESIDQFGGLWDIYLEIQNLESGNLLLQREPVTVEDLIYRVTNNRQMSKYTHHVAVEVDPGLPSVKLDEFRVAQALGDILHYVLEHAGARAAITLKAQSRDQDVVLTVASDSAINTPDVLDKIFEPFIMLDGKMAGGLYIAREMVRRHGGHTWAEPIGTQGVAIRVALPSGAAVARPPDVKPAALPAFTETGSLVPMDTQPIRGVSSPRLGLNTIMIVQGQSTLGRTLHQKLTEQKYDVLEYRDYEEALEDLKSVRIDLVVIDTTTEDIGGPELTKRIRQRSEVPIILIADKASTEERVQGFSNGADEYITKPIGDDELMARIQAIFKRQHIADRVSEPLVIGDLYIDFARRQVFIVNKPVDLTRIEYDLLYHLVVNKGQVLTHKQLLEKVWGPDYANENHYLWVNISRLRKKLEKGAPGMQCIHTQQGIGYFFDL